MNTSAQRDSSSQEVALKLIHLRRAMRDQFQTYAQKDCIERPTHCHEHKAMLDMLTDDHNQMSNSLNESLPYQLDNFAISLKSLNEYISSERQNNEGNSKDILENMSSVFIPSLQSVHSEWSTMLRTISSSMSSPNNSDDDHHYEVSYKNKNKRNNIPAKYQHLQTRSKSSQKTMLPSTRRRSAADKRLKFVQDIFSSTKDLVGDSFNELSEYIGVDTESISSSLANIGAIPDVILTSLSSLWTTEDSEIQKHVENNKIYHTEENEDEEDGSNNLSNIIETINTAMMTGDSLLDGTALPKDDFGFIHDSDNIDINSGDDNMKNTTLPSPFIRNTSSGFELTSIDSIAGIHEGNIAEFKKFVNLHKYAENSSTYSTNALSQKVLSMFSLDAIYDYKYKQEATASKKLTKQSPNSFHSLLSIETGIGMDDGGDDPTPIERLPCGHGKETEATRIEHTCGTRKISKTEYDTAMALPELVPEYPASNPRKPGDDTCEQVDYFMENTFLDKVKYLPNILTPEQIEEMETRGATHSDYLEAVCVVINDRAAKAKENSQDEETTKTDDNENEGEGGSDATWCKRVSNCLFKATCNPIPTVITRTICVCPYGVYGPRCATPAYSKCSVRADKTSQHLHPNGHTEDITPDTSCDISKSTAATPGSQWSKFHNEYRPNFLQLGTHAPCISAQDPSSSSVDVNAKVECEFIQDVYQGVAPMLIPVMNLDGFTWDTNYNFKYDIYRPESGDEEASYDERDSVDAPKPVFALVSEDHIPEILRWNMTVNAFVRPINWNRLSDISQASSFELTNEQLSSIEPSLVSKNVNYASILKTKVTLKDGQTFSPYIPGGRSTWETRILVTGLNAHSYITKGFSWSVEDLEFQPGKPKSQPLSSGATVALVVVGICLLILIIFVIRYIIRKKEEKFFQQVRDVSTQEAQDRAAAAVFRQEE